MKSKFQFLNGIALIATIVINYLSNLGVFNGETMASISKKYQTFFTPAGYAFSIWGIIYLGLLGFVIHYGPFTKSTVTKEKVVSNIGWWFVISCIANGLWVVSWLHEYIFLSILLMVTIFISLLNILQRIKSDFQSPSLKTRLFLQLPIQIYSGWISVALIANVAVLLKKMQWNGFGISETMWTIVMIIIAALVHVFMIWKQKMPVFALVVVWALLAIAIANQDLNYSVFITAVNALLFIFANISFFVLKKKSI